MKLVMLMGTLTVLTACGSTPPDTNATDMVAMNSPGGAGDATVKTSAKPDYTDGARQFAWIDLGKEAIKAKLRDPESAQWRNVKFYSGGGVPIVCGEVNSNNGFGGKAGFERFVAAGDKIDVVESEMESASAMTTIFNRFCQ